MRKRPRLLFLAHRIPYPPEKGEKIRAWHMLDHLAQRWDVDAGFLVDDRADLIHLPALEARCASVHWRPTLHRLTVAAKAMLRARPGLPLTLGWFHDAGLAAWVRQGIGAGRWDAAFVYSSAMAPYVMGRAAPQTIGCRVLDMVDVDSEKWRAYAGTASGLMRHVWAREARTLLAFERRAAREFDHTLLVSVEEAQRFAELAPESAARIGHVDNGVDLSRFDPAKPWPDPYGPDAPPAVVFTGSMSYRPNIEAVTWFADRVMPILAARGIAMAFHIVGARPAAAVRALAQRPGIHVTGTVPEVQPYLAHAAMAVAPLQIARGIQNKVLEAMAMARPVIASPQAFEGIQAMAGRDLLVAATPEQTAADIVAVLRGGHPGLGAAARAAVRRGHDWPATLAALDAILPGATAGIQVMA
jgi:sugar transferase (PEP-CTERM/EpsH1 system associated)